MSSRFSRAQRNAVELLGHIFFLLPAAGLLLYTSWHYFMTSFLQNEQSTNPGGLPQWPIKALIPAAFALLFLQGVSELIKRIAIIRGLIPDTNGDHGYHREVMQAGVEAHHEPKS